MLTDTSDTGTRLERSFRWLWASAGSATFADGIYQVALPIAALRLGGGPAAVAVVYTAARLPWALVALHSGVLVDRFDRRKLMVIANIVRTLMLLAGVIVVTTFMGGIAALAVVALVLGIAETVGDTAMHSLTPQVVSGAHLEQANGRMQATELVTNMLLGPSLGGLLTGIALGLSFGAVALLYVSAALTACRLVPTTQSTTVPGRGTVREGLVFVFTRRTLAVYAIGVGVVNAAFAAFQTEMPIVALARDGLGLSPAGFGLLIGTGGVTGLIIGLAASTLVRTLGNRRTLLLGQTALGIGIAVAGLSTALPVVITGMAGTGFVVLGSIITASYRQRAVPGHMLGRVTAAYRLVAFGGLPIGSAAAGALAAVTSPRVVLDGAGVLVVLAGLVMATATPPAAPLQEEPL